VSVAASPGFQLIAGETVERQFVTLGSRQVQVRRCGSGPAAVLLPPLPYSGALFDPLLERLGRRFTALAPDPAGYGDSAPLLTREPAVEDYAADVLAVLDAVGADRFAL
jgi:pimeloyl-ACP methyl ester carboxylesterase